MPSPTTRSYLNSLILSAKELNHMTDWPEALIEDYLNILSNLITLADIIDVEIDQKIEEIATDFLDGSVPFAEGGFLVEDNPNFNYDNAANTLNILNILSLLIEVTDLLATNIIVTDLLATNIITTDITVNSLTAEMSVATDVNKKLVSIPYLNEETEFFIQAVHS